MLFHVFRYVRVEGKQHPVAIFSVPALLSIASLLMLCSSLERLGVARGIGHVAQLYAVPLTLAVVVPLTWSFIAPPARPRVTLTPPK